MYSGYREFEDFASSTSSHSSKSFLIHSVKTVQLVSVADVHFNMWSVGHKVWDTVPYIYSMHTCYDHQCHLAKVVGSTKLDAKILFCGRRPFVIMRIGRYIYMSSCTLNVRFECGGRGRGSACVCGT